jgi:putative ABC transport system permease protein
MNTVFFTTALVQGLALGGLGFGIYLSLRVFRIPDITTDGSYALGGVISAICLTAGLHPLLALLSAFTGGALAGSTSGLLHTRLKLNPLLAGILVMTALYSVNLLLLGRPNLPLMDIRTFFQLTAFTTGPLSELISILLFILIITGLLGLLLRTDFGIALRATGNNEEMAAAMGISTPAMKITGLAMANGLTALSGSLITQYQGFADINMGIGIVVAGLGAVMIGETLAGDLIRRSIFLHLVAILMGGIVFRLLLAFALSAGADPAYLRLITALLVLLILLAGNFRKKTMI